MDVQLSTEITGDEEILASCDRIIIGCGCGVSGCDGALEMAAETGKK